MRNPTSLPLILAVSLCAFQTPASASEPPASPAATAMDSATRSSLPFRHHALVERQMGLYAVYLPKNFKADSAKGKTYPLCLILHGMGSTEIGHGAMAEAYASEEIIFLAPRAPYPAYEVFMEEKEPGWTAWPEFPQEWGNWDDPDFPREELDHVDAVQLYADWIADCLQDVRKRYPIAAGKAIVVGHSQGAAFAHIFAVKHPELVKAYAAYAGHYGGPELADDKAAKALVAEKVFPLILHCEADSVVSASESRDLIRYLKANKVPFDSKLFPGGNHSIATRPNAAIRSFIYKWGLGRTAPALRGTLIITKVIRHSRADSLGLAVGDRIAKYGGKAIKTKDDYLAAISAAEGKPQVAIVVQRMGKDLKFDMPSGKLGVYIDER
ncbi:MAG: PDZ domain-containing protein [Fibrobacteria bacterium]